MADEIEEQEEETGYDEDSFGAALHDAWDDSEGEDDGDSGQESSQAQAPAGGAEDIPQGSADVPEGAQSPQAPETDVPPVGLSPEARQEWDNVPEAVRQDIAKREADFARGIQMYAHGAKRAQQLDQVLNPYQQYFAMTGQPAESTLNDLLSTASRLQMGTPQQKAETAAQLINQFGVPIDALDSILSGQMPQEQPDVRALARQEAQQMVAPLIQQQQMQEQYALQQQYSSLAGDLQAFAAKPTSQFYNDPAIRNLMADNLDIAANHGQKMTYEEAYERACWTDPRTRSIIQSQEMQPSKQQRRAASSISGSPGGDGSSAPPDSTRSALEMAWENST